MYFSCLVNCGNKKNPDRPFKLVALCIKHCARKINYKWSIQFKSLGQPDSTLKTIDSFGSWLNTDLTQKNLAMKENKMEAIKEYKVRLTGSLDGFEDTYGFSLYDIAINVPPKAPSPGRCRAVPAVGKPLSKVFKVLFSKLILKSSPFLSQYVIQFCLPNFPYFVICSESHRNQVIVLKIASITE